MSLELVYYGHPALRSKGKRIEKIDTEICTLAEEMIETMYEYDGCGLAAQQIGRSLQIAVIDVIEGGKNRHSKAWRNGKPIDVNALMPLILINPEITPVSQKLISDHDACLSIPGLYTKTRRPARVQVSYENLKGTTDTFEAEGLLARALMHEVDHLNGILFIDHLSPGELKQHQPLLEKIKREYQPF